MLIHNNSCPTSEYKTAIQKHNGKTCGLHSKGCGNSATKPTVGKGGRQQNLGGAQNPAPGSPESRQQGPKGRRVHVSTGTRDMAPRWDAAATPIWGPNAQRSRCYAAALRVTAVQHNAALLHTEGLPPSKAIPWQGTALPGYIWHWKGQRGWKAAVSCTVCVQEFPFLSQVRLFVAIKKPRSSCWVFSEY